MGKFFRAFCRVSVVGDEQLFPVGIISPIETEFFQKKHLDTATGSFWDMNKNAVKGPADHCGIIAVSQLSDQRCWFRDSVKGVVKKLDVFAVPTGNNFPGFIGVIISVALAATGIEMG